MELPEGVEINPYVCPQCGADEPFCEVGVKASTQSCHLNIGEDGSVGVDYWGEWTGSDDTDDGYIECSACMASWRSFEGLTFSMKQAALIRWIAEVAGECIDALNRTPSPPSDLYRRIEALSVGMLDKRALDRPDPDPFVAASLNGIVLVVEGVTA